MYAFFISAKNWVVDNKKWIFSGIGTALVVGIISLYPGSSTNGEEKEKVLTNKNSVGGNVSVENKGEGNAIFQSGSGNINVYPKPETAPKNIQLDRETINRLTKYANSSERSDAVQLANDSGWFLYKRKLDDAVALLKLSLVIYDRSKDSKPNDIAMSLFNLGYVYIEQGNYPEAELVLKKSIKILEKENTPNEIYKKSLEQYAGLLASTNRFEEAAVISKKLNELK